MGAPGLNFRPGLVRALSHDNYFFRRRFLPGSNRCTKLDFYDSLFFELDFQLLFYLPSIWAQEQPAGLCRHLAGCSNTNLGFNHHLAGIKLGSIYQYSISSLGFICYCFAVLHYLHEQITIAVTVKLLFAGVKKQRVQVSNVLIGFKKSF